MELHGARAWYSGLSGEEQTLLSNAVLALPSRGLSHALFWGKVVGETCDYLVVVAQTPVDEDEDYPKSEFLFCTTASYKLKPLGRPTAQLPVPRDTPLTGNAAAELAPAVEASEGEGGAVAGRPAFTERDLLAFVVHEIHNATALVPKGAFVADPSHRVAYNPQFSGLSVAEAADVSSYFHLRKPADLSKARTSEGLIRPSELFDSITSTHAAGAWTTVVSECEDWVSIRSLLYPGYAFYHQVGTKTFGGIYNGDGAANQDIAFML